MFSSVKFFGCDDYFFVGLFGGITMVLGEECNVEMFGRGFESPIKMMLLYIRNVFFFKNSLNFVEL
jgi:hypothetical protein